MANRSDRDRVHDAACDGDNVHPMSLYPMSLYPVSEHQDHVHSNHVHSNHVHSNHVHSNHVDHYRVRDKIREENFGPEKGNPQAERGALGKSFDNHLWLLSREYLLWATMSAFSI